jgi:hypothetical protein
MIKKKLFCSPCNAETWHKFLFEKIYRDDSPENYDHVARSIVSECCGCEQPYYFWSTWIENNDSSGVESFSESVFPAKKLHQQPSWYMSFVFSSVFPSVFEDEDERKHVSDLLREVHTAVEQNCPRLGIMGLRALFEHIMISKVGDNGTFKKNLSKFQFEGFLSKIQCESIGHILEAGHAAIHRSHEPNLGELIGALQIAEGIIETIYINPDKSKWVAKNIKPRESL